MAKIDDYVTDEARLLASIDARLAAMEDKIGAWEKLLGTWLTTGAGRKLARMFGIEVP